MGFWECLKSGGKILHGNTYRWSMMKKSSVSRMQRFMYSQILCYVLERWMFGNSSWIGSKIHHNTKLWTQLTENRWNSSEIFYQDSLHCSSSKKSKSSWTKMGESEQFQGRIIFMSMFNDIMWWIKDNEQECIANSTFMSQFAKRFPAGRLSFFKFGSETKWYSTNKGRPRGKWDRVAELMMIKEKADSQFSEPRVHCLEERSKAKEVDNYLFISVPMGIRLKLFFAQIFLSISSISTEQSQIYVRNTVCVKQVRWDPYWQSNLTHCSRQQTCW